MKNTIATFAIALAFVCCEQQPDVAAEQAAKESGITRGGVLRVNEVDYFRSLMPVAIGELNGFHISSQVYEGLVKYDQRDLSIMPALARSWEISEDLLEYTFHLRSDAKFHDDSCFSDLTGRSVTARDVKYCFESLCSKSKFNTQYDVTFRDRVEGANEHYSQSASGKVRNLTGLTIVDDSTLKIRLLHPDANFLNILTMPGCYIYPHEAVARYGDHMHFRCVGTGPFMISSLRKGELLVMKRNPQYWGSDTLGNRLPYLDSVRWSFINDKKTEIREFRQGNLDLVFHIPVEMFHDLMGDLQSAQRGNINFDIYSSPALATHFFGFNLQTNPFFSIREIRQAFNLAIDRKKIADFTLQGEGRAAEYGIVPFTDLFAKKGFDYKSLKGYPYDPDSARKLLEIAAYPGGAGLPDFNLQINSGGGDRNILVAVEIQKMLRANLGVNVNISVVPWDEHISNIQSGKSDFFRYAWSSDYSDPESFLTLFYGKHVPANYTERSYTNFSRFRNRQFDSLYEAARVEPDMTRRYRLFSQADQVILNEAPVMPLFYDENFRLVQKNVRNLPENPLSHIDMSRAYFAGAPNQTAKK